MNPDFLAGAVDVIECFVRELGVLQAQLKEEEKRISTETDEASQEGQEVDLELSVLEITKTALVVTRERLARERSTKKNLQREFVSVQAEARLLRDNCQFLSEEKEEVLATNAQLQTIIDQRNDQIRDMENSLSVARKDTVKAQSELAGANSHLSALKRELSELKTSNALAEERRKNVELKSEAKGENSQTVKGRALGLTGTEPGTHEEELTRTREELACANARITANDQQLAVTRKKLRLAQKNAAAAHSMTAKIRSRWQLLNTRHKLTRLKSKAEYAALREEHETLKVTTRQLIDIVEGLEAAAEKNEDLHSAANCTYHAKYKKVKAENKALNLRLSETNLKTFSTTKVGSGGLKRKTEEETGSGLHGDRRKRRVKFSA